MSEIEKPNRLVDGLMERAQKAESERDEWKTCSEKAKMQLGDWRACAISNATRAQKAEAELERAQRMFQRLAKSRDDWKRLAHDNEARAQKAEAALESAQKMCDHWERKAVERQGQVCEWKRRAENAEFEVKRQKDIANPVDWPRVRVEAAIATMQGMWASQCDNFRKPMEVVAVECADDLVAELQKKEVQG